MQRVDPGSVIERAMFRDARNGVSESRCNRATRFFSDLHQSAAAILPAPIGPFAPQTKTEIQ
jgi:hypothetical protein